MLGCGATGGGSRARRSPCRCRSRRGSGRWRRSARRARSACARAPSPRDLPSSGVSADGASSDARPRSIRASMRLRRSAAALRTVAARRSLLHGLATKSLAPALIASTATDTAPWAVMITTAASGSCSMILPRKLKPFAAVGRAALEIEVEQDRVGAFLLEQRQAARRASSRSRPARTGRAARAARRARCRDRRRRRRQG